MPSMTPTSWRWYRKRRLAVKLRLAELQEKLNAAMQKLSEPHRLVVTLHDVQGLSHEEIAEDYGLQCRHGTVPFILRPAADAGILVGLFAMSMSQDTENFEQLRRLLTLKRYEQPPPRYFNDFSSQVIARIKRGERGDGYASVGRMLWEAPWLQRIWAAFEAKPVLAGAFGVAVCGTLITGVIYSERTDLQPVALIPGTESSISSPVEVANAIG